MNLRSHHSHQPNPKSPDVPAPTFDLWPAYLLFLLVTLAAYRMLKGKP